MWNKCMKNMGVFLYVFETSTQFVINTFYDHVSSVTFIYYFECLEQSSV